MERTLINWNNEPSMKNIMIVNEPSKLKPIINPLSWKILNLLTKKSMYPAEISKFFKIHEQKVYYYIRQLYKMGFLSIEKEKCIKGALAKYYRVTYPAFGVELPFGNNKINFSNIQTLDEKIAIFFDNFLDKNIFNGCIVVGSPEPHGPYKSSARDGHYAVQFAFFLGQFCNMTNHFIVKLDVDIKAEKEERNNLILIGGPGTNLITAEINRYLPIKFNEENYWAGLSDIKGNTFNCERDGLIAKIPNPYDENKNLIVLAGLRYIGTKSAIIAITNFSRDVLKKYKGEKSWATIIRGFDLDGDGKVDSIEKIF